MNIKELLLSQIEKVVISLRYDFLYDDEFGQLLCQVIQRDSVGSIESTPLSFQIQINEEKGTGRLIYYQAEGEMNRQSFDIENPATIVDILTFLTGILGPDSISSKK
ncbi:hypothetical protein ACQKGI_18915 [Peribacillus muralis]|uniref:Uncharacterized protein n=1 Tax=Peribacillus muralis TaxID=264697 RepID=A0A1B3XJQ7_9BACI|nr:hypothetical protein [Peribacillus muralis]AOH53447.1 hypothetical protein ABE28_003710 [Peribacillus muralis]